MTNGEKLIHKWFEDRGWSVFDFQKQTWKAYLEGNSGLLNAPTGSGKTYALFLPYIIDYIDRNPDYKTKKSKGLQLLWITPLRALTKDIQKAMQEVCDDLQIPLKVSLRTGDTSEKERKEQKKNIPDVLLTTPESIHIMLSQKEYPKFFENLEAIIIDEWHEILGTKRGVQIELALSRLKALGSRLKPQNLNLKPKTSNLKIWAISATIGNLEQAAEVLLGKDSKNENIKLIRAGLDKKIEIETIIPDNIEKFSWAGHLGIHLLDKAYPIIKKSKTTLVFTNTRSQTEIWYQTILDRYPEFAGQMAMHHGSLDNDLRAWVEQALHDEILKLVVCTSSLDLGVDFRPVDTVIQIGSPKGVSRFMQRAGRSGHHPGATSKIYFVPTHSLELIEGAALKEAVRRGYYENRDPVIKPYDVLIQYLLTLAVSDGFDAEEIYMEVINTFSYGELSRKEFSELLDFIVNGGKSLGAYDEYQKVIIEDGLYKITNKRIAMRHRLSMGTIISDPSIRIKYLSGGSLGTIEESFIARLNPGDHFWFSGRNLELINVKTNVAYVRRSSQKKGITPSWMGARMPLSSQLSSMIRLKLDEALKGNETDIEVKELRPLFKLQSEMSLLPGANTFLIEELETREGHHLFFYPFEGRVVHEGLSSLFAYRITKLKPFTFSIAMNDYGFELLADERIPIEEAIKNNLFSTENLLNDIQQSLNATELARRKFREIANIAGLVFNGYPGRNITSRHLQASTSLLFDVFREYEPDHLLIRQAYLEGLQYQLEEFRMREALQRIQQQEIVIKKIADPTPFCFPILVDSFREKLTTEKLEDRIKKMISQYDKTF